MEDERRMGGEGIEVRGRVGSGERGDETKIAAERRLYLWSRLGSNQRPSACEADALPLSYETGEHRLSSMDVEH